MKTKKKRVLGILLSLALVIGMVPSMGMTVHAKDNLVGTVITIGDTLKFDNDYIKATPDITQCADGSYKLVSIEYSDYHNGWKLSFEPHASCLIRCDKSKAHDGFEIYEGDGTKNNPYKFRAYYKDSLVSSAHMNDVLNVTINKPTVSRSVIDKAVKKAGASKKYVKSFTLGKKVKKIKAKAFAGYKKAKTLIVMTKKLKKSKVKNSLKGSKIKTIKVKAGSKTVNKKYIKKYKKIFTKKNAGKKVKVV